MINFAVPIDLIKREFKKEKFFELFSETKNKANIQVNIPKEIARTKLKFIYNGEFDPGSG